MLWNRYWAVIFDLDGTLIDNAGSFRLAYGRYCERYPEYLCRDNPRQRTELIEIYHAPDRAAAFEGFCRHWGWRNPPAFPEFWQEWFMLYVHSAVCFPWTVRTLETLCGSGLLLGLITNGAGIYQNAKIQSAGLRRYFEAILISEEAGIAKPNPSVYRICAEQLGIPPEECLFVGDTPESDIAGAKAAGMHSLLLTGKPDTVGATYTSKTIACLLEPAPPK